MHHYRRLDRGFPGVLGSSVEANEEIGMIAIGHLRVGVRGATLLVLIIYFPAGPAGPVGPAGPFGPCGFCGSFMFITALRMSYFNC
jgi:hypothetical protein